MTRNKNMKASGLKALGAATIFLVFLPRAVMAAEAPQSGLYLQGDIDLGLSIHDEFNTGIGVGLGLGLYYLDLQDMSFGGFSAWKLNYGIGAFVDAVADIPMSDTKTFDSVAWRIVGGPEAFFWRFAVSAGYVVEFREGSDPYGMGVQGRVAFHFHAGTDFLSFGLSSVYLSLVQLFDDVEDSTMFIVGIRGYAFY